LAVSKQKIQSIAQAGQLIWSPNLRAALRGRRTLSLSSWADSSRRHFSTALFGGHSVESAI